jgi:hypothetical protein
VVTDKSGDAPRVGKPALAKVTIFEVAERPWGWLTTSAEVDDCIYVGTPEWQAANPKEWRALLKQSKQLAALQSHRRR